MQYIVPLQINDRYEFPLQLDLDRENGKYLSPDADKSVRNLYTLHRFVSLEHIIGQVTLDTMHKMCWFFCCERGEIDPVNFLW
jgi:hypothetical protein